MIYCFVLLNLKFKYIKKLKEAIHVHSIHPSVLPGFTQMPQYRHNLQAFIWSPETPNYGYLDFLLSPHWWVMQTGRVLFSGPCTRPGMFPSAISAHEHIAEQRLDVLVKFPRNLPSELRVVTLNIQQMCLAHVQLLILRDEEFFILAVQPSARSILSQMQPPAPPPDPVSWCLVFNSPPSEFSGELQRSRAFP